MGTKETKKMDIFGKNTTEEKAETAIRNHQDSVFSELYSEPETVFDLYKTLHEDDCWKYSVNDVEIITLKNIILARRYNDVAFKVGDRLIMMVEHQSTINENMPLRMLLYVVGEYEKIIKDLGKDLYKENLIKLPKPEFYIVYTGEDRWDADELLFSDAYSDISPL